MFGNAFYQDEPFYAVSYGRVNVLNPKYDLTLNVGLFICTIINHEQHKYSYGRAVYSKVAKKWILNFLLYLPVNLIGSLWRIILRHYRMAIVCKQRDCVIGIIDYPDKE